MAARRSSVGASGSRSVQLRAPRSRWAKDAQATFALLRKAHPDAHCELNHANAFQLLVATVLSAQSTDVAVNQVTGELFRRWPSARALAGASVEEVQQCINRLGMFRQKAKNLVSLSQSLVERHGGKVPPDLDALTALAGVGRKTANVVLGDAFGIAAGVVVDTHVQRISQRLGWTSQATPERIEQDLCMLFEQQDWPLLSHTLIFHGRRICTARSPQCVGCPVSERCKSAHKAELVGRKPAKPRTTPVAARKPAKPRTTPVAARKAGGRTAKKAGGRTAKKAGGRTAKPAARKAAKG